MKTFYRIFGGKFLRWVLLCITLIAFSQVIAQPCSDLIISGNATICQGSTTNIQFNITGGTPPWRVTYAIDGVAQPEITNINASPYILTTGAEGTYTGVDIYDGTNCQGQVIGSGATVVVNLPPVVDLGPDFYSCTLGGIPLSPLVQNYSSVVWTATGNGTFSNPNSPNTIYYPGTNNISAGHATLTLTVYAQSPCTGSVTDNMTIFVVPGPTSNAGNDATGCGTTGYTVTGASALDYSSVTWNSSGTGIFVNQGSLNPTYYPSVADVTAGSVVLTLSVYGNGNCTTYADTDQMTLFLTPEPLADAGADAMVCEGSSITINDATASEFSNINWSSSGSGTFVNNGSLTPTYTPSAADISSGLVTLTLTASPNIPCSNAVSDSKIVTISPAPTVSAGPDGSVCDNNPFAINNAHATDYSSILWTSSGSGTFSANTSLNTTYTPGASDLTSGSVLLTITAFGDPSCTLSSSDNLLLTIVPSPVAEAGSNGITCENSTFNVLNASASGYSNIHWTSNGTGILVNANTLTPSYMASNHDATVGQVTLTLSATGNPPCNNVIADDMQLTVIPLPTVDAGNNISSCSTAPVNLSGANATAYSSITWTSSGTGTFSNANVLNPVYNPDAADVANGSVVLTITVNPLIPCSGSVSDNLTLSLTPAPTVYAGLDQTSCTGIHLISGSAASNYSSLAWTTSGTGIFSNATTLNPTYTASAQDIANGSVNLLLTAQGQSPCTMEATDFMVLTLPGMPAADAGLNGTVCEDSEFHVTTASASNYGSLLWTTSGNGTFSGQNTLYPVYYPGTSDISNGNVVLTLTAYSEAPCTTFATDQMVLNILPLPQANAGPDLSICEGSQAFISGSVLNSSVHTWTTSGDGTFLNVSTLTPTYVPGTADLISGSVTITLTAYPNGTCATADFDHMILSIIKNPTVNAGNDQTICGNSCTLSTAHATNYGGLLWTTSGSGSFIDPTALHATYMASISDIALGSVTLTLQATGNPPCSGSINDQMVITFTPGPSVFAGQDATLCSNVASYTIADAYATNFSLITWSTSGDGTFSNTADVNPTYYPGPADYITGFVTLSVTATGLNLCNLTDTDEMILYFTDQAVANAGTDLSSCGTQPVQISSASASGFSIISWQHNGTGVMTGASGLTPVYIPSQGDVTAGQVTLTLQAFPNAPCSSVAADQMTISFQAEPTVSAGIDLNICENQHATLTSATASEFATLLWTSSGSGSFSNNSSLNTVYIPSVADIEAGSVILTLSASGIAPCTSVVNDDILLTIQKLPIANAGPDEFTCGNAHQLMQAGAQNFTSVNWSTSGTGSFLNPSLVNAVYIPSAADRLAGAVILTLTVNGQSPCNGQSVDQMTLSIGETTVSNAGPDGSTCGNTPFMITGSSSGTFSSVNWVSSGTGIFANQNTLNPTYTPSASDISMGSVILTMQVQGSAPCFSFAQDDMVLNILPSATANAGPDAQICTGGFYTVSGASASNYAALFWSTSGSGSFVGGNTLSPTYIPGAADYIAGNVTLTLTAIPQGPCTGGVSDDILLTFSDGGSANAGPDAEVCYGSNFTVSEALAGNAALISWSTSGTGTLLNGGTISPTYIPSNGDRIAGSVILTLTVTGNAPCLNTSADFMVLTVNSAPAAIPVISGLQNVCAGQTGVTYSVFPIQYASGYNWMLPAGATIVSGANTNSIEVDFSMSAVSGIISVQTTSSCGDGPVSADFPVNVNPLPGDPGIIMGPDVLCQNTPGVIYTINPVTDATSYQWTVPAGVTIISGTGTNAVTVDFSVTAVSGTITVTPQNGCGNGNTSSLNVTVNPIPAAPVITANGPTEFCEGGSVVLSATPGFASYLWSNGLTTQDITVTTAGTYSVTAIDPNGCASLPSNEITVNVHMLFVPDITASGPLSFCEGGSVTLSAPAGFASYLWNTGQTSQQITVTIGGVYNVTVTDAFGCNSLPSADVAVTVFPVPPAPVITASGPLTFCAGGSVTLTAPAGYASYLWSNGATTPAITVTAPGNYFVSVTGINGCPSVVSNTITVTVLPLPVIHAGSDATICQGNNYTITDASAVNHNTVYWTTSGSGSFNNPASVNPTYLPGQSDILNGSVILTLTGYGCTEVSDFMVLTITPQPAATTGGDQDICFAPTPVTGAVASGYSSLEWSVTFGSGTLNNQNNLVPVYMPGAGDLTTGYAILTLTLNPLSPCVAPLLLTKTLFIHETPTADAGTDETICTGSQLIITTASASNFTSVQWSSSGTGTWLNANTLNPTYIPSNADNTIGFVTLTLTAANGGCPDATDEMTLTIQPELTVNAGPDGYTCEGSNFNITGSSAMLYSSLLWTTSGSGTFNNPAILNPVYSPGPADIAAGSVQLTLTGISATPCNGTGSDALTLFIRQEPQANAGTDGTICQGEQYLITDAVAYDYAYLTWNTSGSGFFLNGTTLTPTYIPSQLDIISGNVVLTLIASNPPCADISDSQTLSITPSATVEAGPDVTICQTCSHTVSGAFVNNAQSFIWTSTGTGTLTGANTFTPTYQPSAADISNGAVTLILTAESYLGCGTFSDQMVIYINQNPNLDFTWNPVCEGQETNFTVDPVVTDINSIAVWHWNFGDGFYSNVINPSHTFPAVGTYNVTLTITDTIGNSSSVTHVVEINSSPVSFFSFDTPNCLGEPTQFHNLSSTENGYITRWVWDYGDGSATDTIYFPNDPNVEHTYANGGIFEVTLNVLNSYGCENTWSTQVTVTPNPVANFYYTTLCEDLLVNFQDASFPNGAGNVVSWAWDFDDPASGIFNTSDLEDPQHIFSAPGTYNVTLTVTNFNNCTGTITKQVVVGGAPAVEFTWEASCASALTSFFADATVINVNAIASYLWEFGDGGQSNLQDPQHMYAAAGNYTVMLTITDTAGCSNTASHLVSVSELPVAFFSFSEPTCFETTTIFNDLSYATGGYITEWEWIFGDGNTTTVTFPGNPHVEHQYANAGVYNVTLNITTSEGCENTVTRQVVVAPNPVANFDVAYACLGEPVVFTDLSQTNGGGNIINWAWNFGDPTSGVNNTSVLQNPTHIYTQPGTYTVSLIVTTANTCADTTTMDITIAPAPVVDFAFTSSCSNDTTQFTSSTFVNMSTTLGWFWEFGDGSTSVDADPVHIYATHGIFNVTLTITDNTGCTATIMHPVSVVPGPVAMFGYNAPACSGSEVQFNNLSIANGSVITTWFWDFGDGTTQQVNAPGNPNVTHVYAAQGAYTVTLTVTNLEGCDASASMTLVITPGPIADFTFEQGCIGAPVNFTDLTTTNGGGAIIQWQWDFGDPASGTANSSGMQNPTHIFNNSGTYTVTLTSTSATGCISNVQHDVVVAPPPVVAFIINSGTCVNTAIAFEPDSSVMDLSNIVSYNWNFGDGSPASNVQTPVHVYNAPGIYQVTLTVVNTDGCINSVTQSITVSALPVAVFSYTSACSGNSTAFTDLSYTSSGELITGWFWNFNDPNAIPGSDTSDIQHPEYNFSDQGLYNVSLTVTTATGCESTVVMPVQVFPAPSAGFSYYTDACANGTVSFQDASTSYMGAITAWEWEFAPGYTSNLPNPHHIFYHTDSCYNVRLIVTDLRGCTDTITQEVCIPAGLEVDILHTSACHGDSISFTPQLLAPAGDSLVAFHWNFNDISSGIYNTSTLRNPSHYFQNTGSYLVSLLVTDVNNCQITVYKRVDILPLPLPAFSYTAGNCDSTIYFTDNSYGNGSNLSTWIWNFGDGTTDTLTTGPANTSHFYQTSGIFDVSLTTITANGCQATINQAVDRMPCITAGFEQVDTLICERHALIFEDRSVCGNPIDRWEWIFGDGETLVYTEPRPSVTHIYQLSGTYSVNLIVSTTVSGKTVNDTTSQSVTVMASPKAAFSSANVCLNSNTIYTDQSTWTGSKITEWFWDFGDPRSVFDTTSVKNPAYRYDRPGNYTTMLTVTNEFGCTDTVSHQLTVHHLPVANFSYSLACQNNHTNFTDLTEAGDTLIGQWWWRFSDSLNMLGLAGVQNPHFVFENTGTYNVELIVVDNFGCRDTAYSALIVNPKPTSAFSLTENYENTQGRVHFTNGSIGATAYEWDFSTGIQSFEIEPVVDFPSDGTYEVTLVTINEFGCPDTLKVDYNLMFKGLWIPNAFSPNNPNAAVRLFKPVGINLSSYTIEVYDTWGNLLWTSSEVDDNGAPVEGWNGVFNGNLLPQDTYMWKATAIFKDGTIWRGNDVGKRSNIPEKTYGTVTLIR